MKLLLDENLSRRLVAALSDSFHDSTHVAAVGLGAATDRDIWEFARRHDYVIMSKDSDFNDLAFVHGPPPKVIWLRLGNSSTANIARTLADNHAVIQAFVDNDDDAVLVIYAPDERAR